jgi:hypothetical protein
VTHQQRINVRITTAFGPIAGDIVEGTSLTATWASFGRRWILKIIATRCTHPVSHRCLLPFNEGLEFDGFVKSPSAALRFTFVVAAYM